VVQSGGRWGATTWANRAGVRRFTRSPTADRHRWLGADRAVHRDAHEYAFRCAEGCGHTWHWAQGSQWPPVVVRRIARDGSTHVEHRKGGI
jgi:hypothetical protein